MPDHTCITILGTRGEIEASAPYHSRHSGVLINEDLLLDLGEPEFLEYHPRWILLTHLHPDHAFFVRRHHQTTIDTPIYAPEPYHASGATVRKLIRRTTLGRYHIRPIPTIHSHKVQSQAYLITTGRKRILYTADLVWIKKWYDRYLDDLDLVITEASFIRSGGMIRRHKETDQPYGHSGLPRLIKRFAPFTNHFVLMHYGSWFYRDSRAARRLVGQIAREHNVDIDVGYDKMELIL
jgi:ribonuclease BN (tRNA processing enzyme)